MPDDSSAAEEGLRESDQDLTAPHGDELRSEVTFGRSDRYTNVDDENAANQQFEPVQGRNDAEQ